MLPQNAFLPRVPPLGALLTGIRAFPAPPDIALDETGLEMHPDTALALALLRHMVQPAILMDPDGRVTLVNPAGMAMIAPPGADGPQGRFWWELWPHADRAELRAALAQAAAGDTASIMLDCRRAVASTAVLIPLAAETGEVGKLLCLLRAR